jgi:hypothetical protein
LPLEIVVRAPVPRRFRTAKLTNASNGATTPPGKQGAAVVGSVSDGRAVPNRSRGLRFVIAPQSGKVVPAAAST